ADGPPATVDGQPGTEGERVPDGAVAQGVCGACPEEDRAGAVQGLGVVERGTAGAAAVVGADEHRAVERQAVLDGQGAGASAAGAAHDAGRPQIGGPPTTDVWTILATCCRTWENSSFLSTWEPACAIRKWSSGRRAP